MMVSSAQPHLVFMGVAGCGKSSLGAMVAREMSMHLVEGDDFHSAANRQKMMQGIALNDADRADWLQALGEQLQAASSPVALTCSALKRHYRARLRAAAPGLLFVFLDLSAQHALQRVAARHAHFFNPSLVSSQFHALESPVDEPGVLHVNATDPLPLLCKRVVSWLYAGAQSGALASPDS
jgi:gluconokinase